ncbi:MAG: flagellar biosynthetic protein FliR [Bacteriovoracaceae bacterium]|nr:flagellar biosynthetic protein FliR [Bacteriovoracaceae bacterium]
MIDIQLIDYSVFVAFWLAFVRISAILFQYPIFDNAAVPSTLKMVTTVLITYTFFPTIQVEILKDINYIGVDHFWVLTIFNALIGLIIGFFVKIIMTTYVSAGGLISQQIGFGALKYFDPTAAAQIGPFEKVLQWTVLLLVITSGALFPLFKGMHGSFFNIHIYDYSALQGATQFYIGFFKSIFLSGLMLSSPLIFTNLLIMSILGVIARTVPQMNVLMVSFVINIGLGLLVFFSIHYEFFTVAYKLYVDKLGQWFQFIA